MRLKTYSDLFCAAGVGPAMRECACQKRGDEVVQNGRQSGQRVNVLLPLIYCFNFKVEQDTWVHAWKRIFTESHWLGQLQHVAVQCWQQLQLPNDSALVQLSESLCLVLM